MKGLSGPGRQSDISDIVIYHSDRCMEIPLNINAAACMNPLANAYRACEYLSGLWNLKKRGSLPFGKTASSILQEEVYEEDLALVFRSLMAAQGVPSSVILAIQGDFTTGRKEELRLFSRVYGSGRDFIVDAAPPPKFLKSEQSMMPYTMIHEGLDLEGMGFGSEKDVDKFIIANLTEIVATYHKRMGMYFIEKLEAVRRKND